MEHCFSEQKTTQGTTTNLKILERIPRTVGKKGQTTGLLFQPNGRPVVHPHWPGQTIVQLKKKQVKK
jgi:hypothetical protein